MSHDHSKKDNETKTMTEKAAETWDNTKERAAEMKDTMVDKVYGE